MVSVLLKVGSVCMVYKVLSEHIHLLTLTCIVAVVDFMG